MKRTTGCAAMLAAMMAIVPTPAHSQQGPGGMQRRGMAAPRPGIEMILRQRERLELSQSQIDQLDKIRAEAVQRRNEHRAAMAEVRSKLLAGEMKREEVRAMMQSQRQAATEVQKQQRERIQSVLNDAQKEKIQNWRNQARAFRMGRMGAMRGQRGAIRGGMGRPGAMRGRPGRPGAMRGRAGMMRGRAFGGAGFGPGMAPRMRAMRGFGFRPGEQDGDGFGPPMGPPPPDTGNRGAPDSGGSPN